MELGRLQAVITADDRQFKSKMAAADQTAKRTAGNIKSTFSSLKLSIPSVGGGLGSAAGALNVAGGNLLTSVLGKVTSGMTEAITVGVNYNKMLEASAVALETLGMSAGQTQKHIADIQALGLKTPFNVQDLIKASLTMNAFGFSTESRIKDLKALSDAAAIAAAGTGDFKGALEGVIMALGQMRAKGKVSAEEMNQLAERGIPAWDILAKKVGKTKEEVMKLAEQGKLRGDVAASLLTEGLGQFAGGAGDRLSQTILGKESNVQDAFQQRAGKDSQALTEAYGRALDTAFDNISKGAGESFTQKVGNTLADDLEFINQLISGKISGAEFLGALKMAGADMWKAVESGFTGAISSAGSTAVDAVKSWAGGIVDSAKSALGIHSPSTVFADIGKDTTGGFDKGITQTIDRSSEGIKKWAKQIEKIGGEEFLKAVEAMAKRLKVDPNKVMNVMAFESGLDPSKKNPGSSATGLIQFMDATAAQLGTTTAKLKSMNAIEQLEYVEKYFASFRKLADTQEALYTAVLAGRPVSNPDAVLFEKGTKTNAAYKANSALDKDLSGTITAREAAARTYAQGFLKATGEITTKFSKATQDFADTVTRLSTTIARPIFGDGAQAKPYPGQIVQGGGASVDIRAAIEPLQTIDLPAELKRLSNETAKAKAALQPLPEPLKEIAAAGPQAASGMNAVTKATKEQIDQLMSGGGAERFKDFKQRLGQGFDDIIGALVTGSDRWQDVARNVAVDFFNTLASEMMLSATGGKYGSLGGLLGGLVGGLFGGFFGIGGGGTGGGHAGGGDVRKGVMYPVGEKGPELFVPGMSGTIIPHSQARQMMQASPSAPNITVVNNFTIQAPSGRVAPETQAQIAARAGQGIQAALQRNG